MQKSGKIIIAIPVKNEEERIGACLQALIRQTTNCDEILLLLNNCTDNTLQICNFMNAEFGKIKIVECTLQDERASAGEARRLALECAGDLAGDGIILTTDADSIANPNWIERNLFEIENGADVVCGIAEIDPCESRAIPPRLHFDNRREAFLLNTLDEIDALVDPDPADSWPRHQQHSGASIAMRAAILHQAGGAPHVANGEDRALIERLRLRDARIRHAPGIAVRVSGRLEGRAAGGMAATIKRRIQKRDALLDDRLEPTVDAYRRTLAKARLRAAGKHKADTAILADDLLISQAAMQRVLREPFFGAAWASIQLLSPVLRRRRVAFTDLARETRQALLLRDQLRVELTVAPLRLDFNPSATLFSGGQIAG